MTNSIDVLERFHRALVEEIQTQRPEYLTGPFTVAEIYQNLVPYGSHRDRIGVRINGDYEDALLRLLAGEGDFLILESEPALRDLRSELGTTNPNTGLYREYAAVDVRLNPAQLDMILVATGEGIDVATELELSGSRSQAQPTSAPARAPTGVAVDAVVIVPPGVDVFEHPAGPNGAPTELGSCQWCRAELPVRDNLNFCPFCGTDLKVVPCPQCGEELEPGWRFCISCGSEAIR